MTAAMSGVRSEREGGLSCRVRFFGLYLNTKLCAINQSINQSFAIDSSEEKQPRKGKVSYHF
jgi:hypothetical protein